MKLGGVLGLSPNFQQMNLMRQELIKNEKLYEVYKKKFAEITKLEDGDKLARDSSGVYYRHEKGLYFIQLRREVWPLIRWRDPRRGANNLLKVRGLS